MKYSPDYLMSKVEGNPVPKDFLNQPQYGLLMESESLQLLYHSHDAMILPTLLK